MPILHIIQLHFPSEGAAGAMSEIGKNEKVFVLQTVTERWFFADWNWNFTTRKPNAKFVGHLSCARGFRSEQLAQAFQRFLAWNGHICDLCEAESGRLVERYSPPPRPVLPKRAVVAIEENKKRGDWFQGR
jgi:hypothetical protein